MSFRRLPGLPTEETSASIQAPHSPSARGQSPSQRGRGLALRLFVALVVVVLILALVRQSAGEQHATEAG